MHISDFDFYKELFAEKSGLYLDSSASFMLDSRLTPVARKWGYPSLHAMSMALRAVPSPQMIDDLVDAMTINDTSFFCNDPLYRMMSENVLPYLLKTQSPRQPLRFWCAGCSTGQEAYSLAILLAEHQNSLKGRRLDILATDLSSQNIERAQKGIYSQTEIQRGLPTKLALKYCNRTEDGWQMQDHIRNMITFSQHNLLENAPDIKPFNVILCRNVTGILAEEAQPRVFENLASQLTSDGFLILGDDEALPADNMSFAAADHIKALYVLRDGLYNMSELNHATG